MSLPYDYFPAVLYAIDMLGQGNTLTEACNQANITVAIFRKYCATHEQLNDMYVDAEQASYDAMADALVNIDNHKIHGQSDAKMAKVISDNIKWVLGKREPKKFGERVQVDTTVSIDIAITSALDAARTRVALPRDDIIDVVPVSQSDDDAVMRELLR